jgi:hypothetical protein
MEAPIEPLQYVWYASYGSNMCKERFMCYIRGGSVEGMVRPCEGCEDPTEPTDDTYIKINHELYLFKIRL